MDFWGDERGQPVQIGFILLFSILVLAFAGYQGYVVPNQNAEIEFKHFQTLENQFAELESNIVNAEGSDSKRSTAISLGVQYPSRLLALNPPPAEGQLMTTDPQEVSIENGDGNRRTDDICGSPVVTSQSLVYDTGYNEFSSAKSITYENRLVARSFSDADLFGNQRLVQDGRIDLLLLTGSVAENGQRTYSMDINATRGDARRVENPNITVVSQFNSEVWEKEILSDVDNVTAEDVGQNQVALDFTEPHMVSCSVVGIGGIDPPFQPYQSQSNSDVESDGVFNTRWIHVTIDGDSSQSVDSSPITVEPCDTVNLTMEVSGRQSTLSIEDPFVDYTFAYDLDNRGSYGFKKKTGNISGSRDSIEFEIPSASEVEDGDSFETYVTAGDNSDVAVFDVRITKAPLSSSSSLAIRRLVEEAITSKKLKSGGPPMGKLIRRPLKPDGKMEHL